MGYFLIGLVIMVIIGLLSAKLNLQKLIAMLIGGGIGFAVGNYFDLGWGIFGAILGGLLGLAAMKEE